MGNARGMAEGISRALLPTTAGLATSIIGIYFSADLNKRAKTNEMIAKDALTFEKTTNKIQDLLT
jgi:biopolymer transport protein ExbB/TolQ